MARRRHRSRRRSIGGWRTLKGFVSPRRRRFTLKRKSRFKRRMRGFKVNPSLAAYVMNPRHRRRHHGRSYRHNPASAGSLTRSVTSVFNVGFIKQGAFATGGAVATITVSNLLATYIVPSLPSALTTGPMSVATKAAVRGATAYLLDMALGGMLGGSGRAAFRGGAAIAIVGSALLDFMGKSFVLGAGDGSQQPQAFVPSLSGVLGDLGGTGSYAVKRLRALRGMAAYAQPAGVVRTEGGAGIRQGGGGVRSGMAGTVGNAAHRRLYGGD